MNQLSKSLTRCAFCLTIAVVMACRPKETPKSKPIKPQISEHSDLLKTDSAKEAIKKHLQPSEPVFRKLTLVQQDSIIRQHFGYRDSIKIISCQQYTAGDYEGFEYVVMAFQPTPYHQKFIRATSFDQQDFNEWNYNKSEDLQSDSNHLWSKTLKTRFPDLLTTWIRLYKYKGASTVYNNIEYHGGYYVFTDSLIYDYFMMDGPSVYRYLDVQRKADSTIDITFQDLNRRPIKHLRIHPRPDGSVMFEHEGQYLDDKTGYHVMIPHSAVTRYPIIHEDGSDPPIVNFDN